jgi:GH35 family endo-1,4-beta-xylanase
MKKKLLLLLVAGLYNIVFSYVITNETKSITNWKQRIQSYPGWNLSDISNIITTSESDNSAWRTAARTRIDNNRKADITIAVKDRDGNDLPDMTVTAELIRHDFKWGGVARGPVLNDEDPDIDTNTYMELFVLFFNAAGFQNALKTKLWSANNEDRVNVGTNFFDRYGIPYRGHALIWPRPNNTHADGLVYIDGNHDLQLVTDHYGYTNWARSSIQAHNVKFDTYCWDVINEMRTCLLWTNYSGYTALKAFLEYANDSKHHAEQKLMLNEWGVAGRTDNEDSIQEYMTQASNLLAIGAPLDGLGFQGRVKWNKDWTASPKAPPTGGQYYNTLHRFAQAFPDFLLQVTEYEVPYHTNYASEDEPVTYMEETMEGAFSEPKLDAIHQWTFFSNNGNESKYLIEKDGTITKRGQVWLYTVRHKFTTETNGQSDNGGDFTYKGFKGEYMVTISNSTFQTNFFVHTTNTETIPVICNYTRTVAKAPIILLKGENNLLDTSSNGNVHNGSIIDAGLTYVAGADGNAISMDGADTSFGITHDSELETSFSLSFWIKWPGTKANSMIALCKGSPWAGTGGFQFTINNWGGWKYAFWGRTNAGTFNQALGDLDTAVFDHVGLTYDKTAGVYQAYFNGTLVLTMSNVNNTTTGDFIFGKRTGTDFGDGVIDHFKYFDLAFTPGEMKWLYENDFSNIITNSMPYVESTAPTAYPNAGYTYALTINDPDLDPVSTEIVTKPAWMSFDSNTVTITGIPLASDIGTNWISLRLDDGKKEVITNQHFIVVESNNLPYVSSTPPSPSYPGDVFGYTVTFGDADSDPVTASLISAPAWMSFEPSSNFLSGIPTYADVESNAVELELTDGKNVITNIHYVYINYNPGGRLYTTPIVRLMFENDLLDTSSNGNVHDASVVDGTVTNYVAGTNGNAMSMDGADLSYGVVHDNEFEDSFTMTFWVSHPGTLTANKVVLSKGNPYSGTGGFMITLQDWSGWKYAFWGRTNTGTRNMTVGSMDTNSGFDQIGIVYDKPGAVYKGYFNGALVFTMSNVTDANTSDILFGKRTGTDFGNAVVDHFKYYNEIFDEAVMLGLYSNDFSNIANYPPVLSSTPPPAYTNTPYSYVLDFTNVDGDTITPSFTTLPAWLTYTSSNQTLSGTPGSGDMGSNALTIVLSDGLNIVTNNQYILVTNNTPPALTSIPAAYTLKETYFSYTITYDDLDSVTVTVADLPSWMVFTNANLTLSGTPLASDVGSNFFTIILDDGQYVVSNTQHVVVQSSLPPIVLLKFEGDLLDTSYNASTHDGVVGNPGAAYVAGTNGTGLDFSGTNATATIPYHSEFAGDFTITFWLKAEANTNGAIFVKGNAYDNTKGGFFIDTQNWGGWKYIIWTRTNGGTVNQQLGLIDTNNFSYFTLTYDSANSNYSYYRDGVKFFDVPNAPHTSTLDMIFGVRNNKFGNFVIDHFKFYDSVLSDTQIQLNYSNDFSAFNPYPYLVTTFPAALYVGSFYSNTIIADDPLGDPVTIDVTAKPSWLSHDTNTQVITGTPLAGDMGTNLLTIILDDGENVVTNDIYILITNNLPPQVDSTPQMYAYVDNYYAYTISASDPLGDAVTYTVISSPGWMTYTASNSLLSGTPAGGDIGSNEFGIEVSDGLTTVTNYQYVMVDDGGEPIIILEYENNLTDTSAIGADHSASVVDG